LIEALALVVGVVFPAMDGVIEIGDHAEKAFALWGAGGFENFGAEIGARLGDHACER
jgi:hypothetical protein